MTAALVVGLTGYARSGKDTVGGFLAADHGFWSGAFADGVRDALLALDPIVPAVPAWPGEKPSAVRLSRRVRDIGWESAKAEPEVRRLLQRMGTEAGWQLHGRMIWVGRLLQRAPIGDRDVVVTDVRFPHEAAVLRDLGGHLVRVVRPGVSPVNGHGSETAADELRPDVVLRNDGSLEDLRVTVAAMVRRLRSGAPALGPLEMGASS